MGFSVSRFMAEERDALSTIDQLLLEHPHDVQEEILRKLSRKIHAIHQQLFWKGRNPSLSTEMVCGAVEELRDRALGCFGKDVSSSEMPNYSALRQIIDLYTR